MLRAEPMVIVDCSIGQIRPLVVYSSVYVLEAVGVTTREGVFAPPGCQVKLFVLFASNGVIVTLVPAQVVKLGRDTEHGPEYFTASSPMKSLFEPGAEPPLGT